MRTKAEIDKEIKALKALKPQRQFAAKIAREIKVAIEELEYGWDDTAAEFDELPDGAQLAIQDTRRWKEGDSDEKPSKSWKGLVKA